MEKMKDEQVESSAMFVPHLPPEDHRRSPFRPDSDNDLRQAAPTVIHPDVGDGPTIEVARRRRGRPLGSKNKPRPPIIITRESDPPMCPHILEVPGGADIISAVTRFSRRRNLSLCVLAASGAASNVTLRQPSAAPASTVTFHGRFDILSLSATCLPPPAPECRFTVSVAGPQGQIVGGIVSGGLFAAGTVYVISTSLNNPSFHRLPGDESSESPTGRMQDDVMWSAAFRQPPPPNPQPPY